MSELGALASAVTSHRHVGKRPEVCREEQRVKNNRINLETEVGDEMGGNGDEFELSAYKQHKTQSNVITFMKVFNLLALVWSPLRKAFVFLVFRFHFIASFL